MKSSDVINQLLATLPQETDKFTDTVAVSSASYSAPTLTVGTSGVHGLSVNNLFHLVGANTPIPVTTLIRSGTQGAIITSRAHDRTFENIAARDVVTLSGFNEPEFNGQFVVSGIPNRTGISIVMPDSGATSGTGPGVVEDVDRIDRSFNRLLSVATVPSTTQITSTSSITGADSPLIANASLRVKPRISGAVSFERAVEAYTKQNTNQWWAYVVLGDSQSSRGQDHRDDSVDAQILDTGFRQQVSSPFSVLVFAPATDDIAGRRVADEMRDLWGPMCRCLLGKKFPSQLGNSTCNPVQFSGHGLIDYATAYVVHGFAFEATEELGFVDTIGYSESVAFRDIDMTVTPNLDAAQGDGNMNDTIDLDVT